MGIPSWCIISFRGQLNLLFSVRWKTTNGQSVVMLCGWGVEDVHLIPFVDVCGGS